MAGHQVPGIPRRDDAGRAAHRPGWRTTRTGAVLGHSVPLARRTSAWWSCRSPPARRRRGLGTAPARRGRPPRHRRRASSPCWGRGASAAPPACAFFESLGFEPRVHRDAQRARPGLGGLAARSARWPRGIGAGYRIEYLPRRPARGASRLLRRRTRGPRPSAAPEELGDLDLRQLRTTRDGCGPASPPAPPRPEAVHRAGDPRGRPARSPA